MENNLLKIYQNQSTGKLSNPRWRPRWPPIGLLWWTRTVAITFYTLDRSTSLWLKWRVLVVFTFCMWFCQENLTFSIFITQKCEKLHCTLWQLLRAITRTPLKIRARSLHQTGGFRARPIEWCHLNWPLTDPCCHGNPPPLLEQKIGYNSACMEDATSVPAPSRGFSGSSNLIVIVKFVSDQPPLPW